MALILLSAHDLLAEECKEPVGQPAGKAVTDLVADTGAIASVSADAKAAGRRIIRYVGNESQDIAFHVKGNAVLLRGVGAIDVEIEDDKVVLKRVVPAGDEFWPETQIIEFKGHNGSYEFVPKRILRARLAARLNSVNVRKLGINGEVTISRGAVTYLTSQNGQAVAAKVGADETVSSLLTDRELDPKVLDSYVKHKEIMGRHRDVLREIIRVGQSIGELDSDMAGILAKAKLGYDLVKLVQKRLNDDIRAANPNASENDFLSVAEVAAVGQLLTGELLTGEVGAGTAGAIEKTASWMPIFVTLSKLGLEGRQSRSESKEFWRDIEEVAKVVKDQRNRNVALVSALGKIRDFDLHIRSQSKAANVAIINLSAMSSVYARGGDGTKMMASLKVGSKSQYVDIVSADVHLVAGEPKPKVIMTDARGSSVDFGQRGNIKIKQDSDGTVRPVVSSSDDEFIVGDNVEIRPRKISKQTDLSIKFDQNTIALEFEKSSITQDGRRIKSELYFGASGQLELLQEHGRVGMRNPLMAFHKKGLAHTVPDRFAGSVWINDFDLIEDSMAFEFMSKPGSKRPLSIGLELLPTDIELKDYSLGGSFSSSDDGDQLKLAVSATSADLVVPGAIDAHKTKREQVKVPVRLFSLDLDLSEKPTGTTISGGVRYITDDKKAVTPEWIKRVEALAKDSRLPLLDVGLSRLAAGESEARVGLSQGVSPNGGALGALRLFGSVSVFEKAVDAEEAGPRGRKLIELDGKAHVDSYGNVVVEQASTGIKVYSIPAVYGKGKEPVVVSVEAPTGAVFPPGVDWFDVVVGKSVSDGKKAPANVPARFTVTDLAGKPVVEAQVERVSIRTTFDKPFGELPEQDGGNRLRAKVVDHRKGIELDMDLSRFSRRGDQWTDIQGEVEVTYKSPDPKNPVVAKFKLKVKGVKDGKIIAEGSGDVEYKNGNDWFIVTHLEKMSLKIDQDFGKMEFAMPAGAGFGLSIGEQSLGEDEAAKFVASKPMSGVLVLSDEGLDPGPRFYFDNFAVRPLGGEGEMAANGFEMNFSKNHLRWSGIKNTATPQLGLPRQFKTVFTQLRSWRGQGTFDFEASSLVAERGTEIEGGSDTILPGGDQGGASHEEE